jgi:hypothetical protein
MLRVSTRGTIVVTGRSRRGQKRPARKATLDACCDLAPHWQRQQMASSSVHRGSVYASCGFRRSFIDVGEGRGPASSEGTIKLHVGVDPLGFDLCKRKLRLQKLAFRVYLIEV